MRRKMSLKTVGVILISDEILHGEKTDTFSKYLIKELTCLGFNVGKVSTISDRVEVICNEFHSLIRTFDVIVAVGETCGSIYKTLGKMTTQELETSEDLTRILTEIGESFSKTDILLPRQARILHTGHCHPVVHFQRIFILKEKCLKSSFTKILKNHLMEYRKERDFRKIIEINKNGNLSFDLNEFKTNNSLQIEFSKNDKSYIFNVSSPELREMVEFQRKIAEKFHNYAKFVDNSDVWGRVYSSGEKHIKNAIENIENCLQQFGLENIFVSFNGGKDCTVLLHLVLTVVRRKYPQHSHPIPCLYVQSESPFPEQDEFIDLCKCYYNLKIMTLKSGIKDALAHTLQQFPNYKACFMGTRRTDPFSGDLSVFQMTDANWPQILRVSPVLDWHYSDIWDYLLLYKVPYCKLYDLGFTSLGNTVNTERNPSLKCYDPFDGSEFYLPAYKLLKEGKERNGRHSS
ncbi:FAD synthase-like isoform X2 [Tribolium madens]|uniref:FAD synthase-like isoform X2 n=1 Tax=Tribolium madens TaxID=41895 RepID=UPI001CF753BE|nr:FAD synthase-like isoform X2 [Tribolium madens]